jgi:tetratricopeptide (TPR) repeat protein
MRRVLLSPLLLLSLALPCAAQDASLNLVPIQGKGRIAIKLSAGWKLQQIFLYDHGNRPVLQLRNEAMGLDASFILFPNNTGAATAESCRDAVMKPAIKNISQASAITDIRNTVRTGTGKNSLAIASYFIPVLESLPIQQDNVFGFYGDDSNCAEIHISEVHYTPAEEDKLFDQLNLLVYDSAYVPTARDYLAMATAYYEQKSFQEAAWYYTSAIAALPAGPGSRNTFRFASDQLVMSLGMNGQLKESRAAAQQAIAVDPEYAMTYYLLACDDAEEGHADAAKLHLQQAFDRKMNVLPGEKLPDPTQDGSLLKLQHNKKFWAFVENLQATR